jgi:hypothetical protein
MEVINVDVLVHVLPVCVLSALCTVADNRSW